MHYLVDQYIFCSPFLPVASLEDKLNSDEIEDPASNPERDRELSEVWDAISRFLTRLKERDRQVVVRVFWRGESRAAVARDLGISGPAITKILRKVMAAGQVYLATHRDCCLLN